MKPPQPAWAHPEIEAVRLVWLAAFVSVFSFLYYQRHGDILFYGDAVAHINIARRIFDSQTPGLLQLGTVWLPLPHLLILPFIVPMRLWQSGTGGSIPSMAGYILGVLGIFRFVRSARDSNQAEIVLTAKVTAWAAAILYAANPNLIYMQATAMGESLYLAFFIWALVFFAEFARLGTGANSALTKCGLCLAAACLTRYDGWFLAAFLIVGAGIVTFNRRRIGNNKSSPEVSRSALIKFILIAAAGPSLWLAYNAAVYRNPLEFANGPYSARAIEEKTKTVNPAKGSLIAAGSYFLKAAELNVGEADWQGRLWLCLAIAGSALVLFNRGGRVALLFWIPLAFYALSIAYASVPIFVPAWWPFSSYNVRYGLELLPAFAIFVPLAIAHAVRSVAKLPSVKISWPQWQNAAFVLVVIALVSANYSAIWRAQPICYREAQINSRGRIALEDQLVKWITSFPSDSRFLMYLGEHSGVFEQAGIPLRRVINEGNHRVWKEPYDSQGLWERALADPGAYANYAIGFEGGPVWNAAKAHHLVALVEIHTTGQAAAAIFQGAKQPLHSNMR